MNETSRQTAAQRVADKLRAKLRSKAMAVGSRVPTIRQVAQEYKVSVNTAMYALRQLEDEGLVQRQPNAPGFVAGRLEPGEGDHAEAAVGVSLRQIAVTGPVGPRQDYAWWDEWGVRIVVKAEQALLASGSYVPVRVGSVEPEEQAAIDQIIVQIQSMGDALAGVLAPIANTPEHERLFNACDAMGVPWISVNRPVHQQMNNFVSLDSLRAGQLAGRFLLELGVRRVLVLARDLAIPSEADKALGLVHAYWQAGLQADQIRCVSCGHHHEPSGYEAMARHLKTDGPPEAVFGLGDMLAAGAMRACQAQGLSIPDDVRVLGGTGLDLAEYTNPPLTVLAQPMEAMGERAVAMLLNLIESGQQFASGELVMPHLVPRASLGISDEQVRRVMADFDGIKHIANQQAGAKACP